MGQVERFWWPSILVGLRSLTPSMHLHQIWFVSKVSLLIRSFHKSSTWLPNLYAQLPFISRASKCHGWLQLPCSEKRSVIQRTETREESATATWKYWSVFCHVCKFDCEKFSFVSAQNCRLEVWVQEILYRQLNLCAWLIVSALRGWDARDLVNRWAKLGDFCSHGYWWGFRSLTPFMHLHQIRFVSRVSRLNSRLHKGSTWLSFLTSYIYAQSPSISQASKCHSWLLWDLRLTYLMVAFHSEASKCCGD